MKITFIRHSKTHPTGDIPIEQWGLTEQGVELAHQLSSNSIIRDIEVMYSSLQTKALETAVLLAKPHGIPIKTDHGFTEISSFTKKFFGREEYERLTQEYYSRQVGRIVGGETIEEGLARFDEALNEAVGREHAAGRDCVGVVSHSNILSMFTSRYCDKGPLEIEHAMRMPDVAVFDRKLKKFITFWGETL